MTARFPRVRRSVTLVAAAALSLAVPTALSAQAVVPNTAAELTEEKTFLVLANNGVSTSQARAAIEAAGGSVKSSTDAIGMFEATTTAADFATKVLASDDLAGATANTIVGKAPKSDRNPDHTFEALDAERGAQSAQVERTEAVVSDVPRAESGDTFADIQWDMKMMKMDEVHAINQGEGVLLGVMDTGVEGNHPDLAANFNRELSRNFTVDIPELDGPCEEEPDQSCEDPSDVDEGGHGTHVAGTMAAAMNDVGIVGMAPKAQIVNLRVGQDSGYFFLKATVDALVYAGQVGIDAVNMSYYIDPWKFNCPNNPADSPEEQAAQKMTIEATQRALTYAKMNGVALISSAGNSHKDLDNVTEDSSSPNIPEGAKRDRVIDGSCVDLPSGGKGVINVSAVGPNGLKADYSNWGLDAVSLAAPGGYWRANFGTDKFKSPKDNLILSTYPKLVAIEKLKKYEAYNEETGESTDRFILSDCPDGKESCSYYTFMQGTSMASPHVAGAAGLVISKHGRSDGNGGKKMSAWETDMWLHASTRHQDCPAEGFVYPEREDKPEYGADSCKQVGNDNTWYGSGILNPLRAVAAKGATRHMG